MSRFVSEVTSGGAAADILGTGSTVFCGDGSKLYDVPGAFTPIAVCCNWDTAIAEHIRIDVNFSCYDCIVVRYHGSHNCYNSTNRYFAHPSNSLIEGCNDGQYPMWCQNFYTCGVCNLKNLCCRPYIPGCYFSCQSHSFEVTMSADSTPSYVNTAYSGIGLCTSATGLNGSMDKAMFSVTGDCASCYYQGCWPTAPKSFASLAETDFCQIVLGNENCCLIPYLCCCSSYALPQAMFGVWGIPRSNPNVTGKTSAYL
jgi:hypothetical protein